MIDILKEKKAIFFDVGYTLNYPPSGDWLFTRKCKEMIGEKIHKFSQADWNEAVEKGFAYLDSNHLITNSEEEYEQFIHFYAEIAECLNLELTERQIKEIAYDRTFNMDNYAMYEDTIEVLETLEKTHKLGVISDTWPSIEMQLETLGIRKYFTTTTYSCFLGTFKPDKRMYIDALEKMGVEAKAAVFIDDRPCNLESAAELGITPILIAANKESDVEVPYLKIYSLKELLIE